MLRRSGGLSTDYVLSAEEGVGIGNRALTISLLLLWMQHCACEVLSSYAAVHYQVTAITHTMRDAPGRYSLS
jgi:hypothetical protein